MDPQFFAFSRPVGFEWLMVIVVLLFLFVWIRSIVEIINDPMPAKNRILWLILLVCTGILGLIIYSISRTTNSAVTKSTQQP
ncbi:MAG: PLDc N-terminal domain-containing protein [Chitinophagaceae bacterium]|nr:PLDc N-terminal domain-containing protein [Chitinophagaceae bacterium]